MKHWKNQKLYLYWARLVPGKVTKFIRKNYILDFIYLFQNLSGKGTQCANIVDEYNYVHLSAGDLLRAERNRPGSELAQTIEEYIQAGRIIPVAVTCSLLERAMNDQMKVSCMVIFCGIKK